MEITFTLNDSQIKAFRRRLGIPEDLPLDSTITRQVNDRVVIEITNAVLQPAVNDLVNQQVAETMRSIQNLSDADRVDVQQQLSKIVADKQTGAAGLATKG